MPPITGTGAVGPAILVAAGAQCQSSAAAVIGRRLFDLTIGWDGKPAASEHVYVQMRR